MPLDVVSQHKIEAELLHRPLAVGNFTQEKIFWSAVPHLSNGIQPFPHLGNRQIGDGRRYLPLLFFFSPGANGHVFFVDVS